MIAYDLWTDIIKYVPTEDLQLLSKTSPIFDEIIFHAGIRIFYGSNTTDASVVLLKHGNYEQSYTIVQSQSGKKDVLLWITENEGDHFKSLVHGNEVFKDNITWTNCPSLQEIWYMSIDGTVAISYTNNFITFTNNFSKIKTRGNHTPITNGITGEIKYIDFDSCLMVQWEYIHANMQVAYETFKVTYSNGKFL